MTGHDTWGNIKHRRGASNRPLGPGPEVVHEGYGPGGAAVMVICSPGNPDRTLAALRATFTRHGGHFGARGSVAYLFNEVGLLRFPGGDRETLAAAAFAVDAEDVVITADGAVEVLTDPQDFARVNAALERAGLRAAAAGVTRRSSVSAWLAAEDAAALRSLLEALADIDGVQEIYTNGEIAADG